jgi:hypothetical protein
VTVSLSSAETMQKSSGKPYVRKMRPSGIVLNWYRHPTGWGVFTDRTAPLALATYATQEAAFVHGVFLTKVRKLHRQHHGLN